MQNTLPANEMNCIWEQKILALGADFVRFTDITSLPENIREDYSCAVIFGKALSKEYLCAIRDGITPKTKEIFNTEQKMDKLAVKVAGLLDNEGYKSAGKLKTGQFPHKTAALMAGLGFIGKNNLLVTLGYGCGVMLGKVLTQAEFITENHAPEVPLCADCDICVKACEPGALLGKAWSITTTRDEIITRKKCTLCHKCMVTCPYTAQYIK